MIKEVEEKVTLIEGWAKDGLTQQQIANNLGIGLSTLKKYKNKLVDKKQASGNFGTMIPRDLFEEINEFLAKNHITKVQLIFAGYEALKEQIRKETETTT